MRPVKVLTILKNVGLCVRRLVTEYAKWPLRTPPPRAGHRNFILSVYPFGAFQGIPVRHPRASPNAFMPQATISQGTFLSQLDSCQNRKSTAVGDSRGGRGGIGGGSAVRELLGRSRAIGDILLQIAEERVGVLLLVVASEKHDGDVA